MFEKDREIELSRKLLSHSPEAEPTMSEEAEGRNVGPCPGNWPNGTGMGNGQHDVECYDLGEDVKVHCIECGQHFFAALTPASPYEGEPVEREDQEGYWDGFKDASEMAIGVIAKVDRGHPPTEEPAPEPIESDTSGGEIDLAEHTKAEATSITPGIVSHSPNQFWADALRAGRDDMMYLEDFEPSTIAHIMECAAVKLENQPASTEERAEPEHVWAERQKASARAWEEALGGEGESEAVGYLDPFREHFEKHLPADPGMANRYVAVFTRPAPDDGLREALEKIAEYPGKHTRRIARTALDREKT